MSTQRTPARLNGHVGTLVEREDASLLWQGELSQDLMTDLMTLGSCRAVRIDSERLGDRDVMVQRCWYDVEQGRLVVQLRPQGMRA